MVGTSRQSRRRRPFPRPRPLQGPGRDRATQRPSAPEDIMTRYTPRRPQAAPRWFVAAWLAATALITAASALVSPATGAFH
jgi:hypothetical protein